jgi:hypothetical protein
LTLVTTVKVSPVSGVRVDERAPEGVREIGELAVAPDLLLEHTLDVTGERHVDQAAEVGDAFRDVLRGR